MLCRNPYQVAGSMLLHPCGQCMNCRLNRRRQWTHRLMLEATQHSSSSFVTLTYADQALPVSSGGLPTLNPNDLKNWLKRIRVTLPRLTTNTQAKQSTIDRINELTGHKFKQLQISNQALLEKLNVERKLRFFAVGEYGDRTERPHYHVLLFGYPNCENGRSRFTQRRLGCCPSCNLILASWSNGLVDVAEFNQHTAQYCAQYVVKKMTSPDDPRLNGRHPEFARMSLRPGIGFGAVYDVADAVLKYDLDLPSELRHGAQKWPLGRYLTNKLSEMTGKEKTTGDFEEEMRALYARALADKEVSAKERLVKETSRKALSQVRMSKIRGRNEKI